MPKRHCNLFDSIISISNLSVSTYKACLSNGRTSPSKRKAVLKARDNPKKCVDSIIELLTSGHYKTSSYSVYPLFDPKLRLIYALPFYPDRIVHHAIMNVLEPIWDSLMDSGSYACRKGKGQHEAGTKCGQYVRKYKYCAQFDISQFYVNINHEILKCIIRKKIKDEKLLNLLDEIVDSVSTRDMNLNVLYGMKARGCTHKDLEREIKKLEIAKSLDSPNAKAGVPIGSYTSQWFGNLYLNELDTYIKQELHIKAYIRYCDDFLLFLNDKTELNRCKGLIKAFLTERLHLQLSKAEVFPTSHGVDFVGYRYFPKGYVLLRKRTAKKQKIAIKAINKKLDNGTYTVKDAEMRIASMRGWLQWAQSHNFKVSSGYYDLEKKIERLSEES